MTPLRLIAPTALAVLLSSARAFASDDDDLSALLDESVVTTASSTAETGRDAPATSTVITGDDIRKYGARSLTEAMDMLALGTMSARGGDAGEMGARGIMIAHSSGQHFLLLINGQKSNDVVFGAASFEHAVPLEIIDHVEVILGPGAVLYGSNAMLGVVNVVTKSAKDFSGGRVGIESSLVTSVRPWAAYGTTFKLFGVEGEVTTQLEYTRQWGPSLFYQPIAGGVDPLTGNPVRYTSASQGTGIWGGAESAQASTVETATLITRARLGKFDLTALAGTARVPIGTAPSDFDSDTRNISRRLMANLTYEEQLSAVVKFRSRAYLNITDNQDHIYLSRSPECPTAGITCRLQVSGAGVVRGLEVVPSFDWLKNGTLVTMVGADVGWRRGRSLVNEYDRATGTPVALSTGIFDHEDVAVGAYAQQTWSPVRWFGLNAGGRLDYDQRFSPVVSPRLAIRVDPWRGGTLKVVYAEAYRAPSFYESYFSHPLSPVADGLRPEREQSIEASIEQRVGAHRIMFGGFATKWTDLIEYDPFTSVEAAQYVAQHTNALPPLFQYRNLSSVNNWGMNMSFEGSQLARTLQYGVNATAAIARYTDDHDATTPLTVSPRIFGNAHVAYDLPGILPTVALAASGQSRRAVEQAFTAGFSPTPYSPMQIVFHATLSGALPGVKGLSYRLTGFYSTTDREPFLVGPVVGPSAAYTTPGLNPIDRARVTLGLQYEFSP
jgi:outer membrane receptor for ferrienterochelin and colicins